MSLAFVFVGLAAFLTVVGIVYEPFVLVVALLFAVVAYLMWYQASGRLGRRIYRHVEERARANNGQNQRGGFGGGPREEWDPRSEWARRDGFSTDQQQERQKRRGHPSSNGNQTGPTTAEAYDILGLDPSADEATIKRAYRERVKEVHPDTETGSKEEFKRVNAAYEQLTNN
jgi:hypothetical protein